ncbi:MAG: adenosylmethionine--8-amino-7-oxononanoate transaminase [Corynebacteriales bacterium]|nr:adenosylmethionine--8-amino-7-oxononanoate transaminase [Mycobacteriales bacterium]
MTITSELWRERDAAAVWHPFTQHAAWIEDKPAVIERAEGPWLFDVDGVRYLDGISSLWTTTVGHRTPEIDAAITAQLGKLDHSTFLGATHQPGIELAEELLTTAPGMSKVFYAGDGSSAVEAALKMAYQSALQRGQTRPLFVHLTEAYHGDTLGSVSVGGIELFHDKYRPILLDTLSTGSPGMRRPDQSPAERALEAGAELEKLMAEHGERVCAIIVEPMVQGAAGILTYDAAYLRTARRVADAYGALLICDEVATGVGRTGKMWAIEHAGITPDLLVCGKGLTAGYLPLSAVLATEEVYEAFLGAPAQVRTFFHGHTFTANPLCCAAAIANLRMMKERAVVDQAAELGERLAAGLISVAKHPGVKEVRQLGTMIGVQVEPRGDRTGFEVCRAAMNKGVWLRPLGDVVVVMPPLTLAPPETDLLLGALETALDEVLSV